MMSTPAVARNSTFTITLSEDAATRLCALLGILDTRDATTELETLCWQLDEALGNRRTQTFSDLFSHNGDVEFLELQEK